MTTTTAADMVELYIAAEKAVLDGQTFKMGDTEMTLANLEQIRAGRREWERRAAPTPMQAPASIASFL